MRSGPPNKLIPARKVDSFNPSSDPAAKSPSTPPFLSTNTYTPSSSRCPWPPLQNFSYPVRSYRKVPSYPSLNSDATHSLTPRSPTQHQLRKVAPYRSLSSLKAKSPSSPQQIQPPLPVQSQSYQAPRRITCTPSPPPQRHQSLWRPRREQSLQQFRRPIQRQPYTPEYPKPNQIKFTRPASHSVTRMRKELAPKPCQQHRCVYKAGNQSAATRASEMTGYEELAFRQEPRKHSRGQKYTDCLGPCGNRKKEVGETRHAESGQPLGAPCFFGL